jgi:hypothetical protein
VGAVGGRAGVGQADLAAGGQGALGLARLIGEQAAAFGGLEQALVHLLMVEGAGGDQVVKVAGGLDLPNYINNWRRLGFTDDDFVGQGSDRLVDALVAWGDVEAVSKRVKDHLDAGADHVCIQVFDVEPRRLPSWQWRTLATAML